MNSKDIGKFGLMYRNVFFYRAVMRYLYGKEYLLKYQVVVNDIPDGSDVLDLCCGDCMIAQQLTAKKCTYRGLDASPWFVESARNKGLNVTLWNGKTDEIPAADVICLQSSLNLFQMS